MTQWLHACIRWVCAPSRSIMAARGGGQEGNPPMRGAATHAHEPTAAFSSKTSGTSERGRRAAAAPPPPLPGTPVRRRRPVHPQRRRLMIIHTRQGRDLQQACMPPPTATPRPALRRQQPPSSTTHRSPRPSQAAAGRGRPHSGASRACSPVRRADRTRLAAPRNPTGNHSHSAGLPRRQPQPRGGRAGGRGRARGRNATAKGMAGARTSRRPVHQPRHTTSLPRRTAAYPNTPRPRQRSLCFACQVPEQRGPGPGRPGTLPAVARPPARAHAKPACAPGGARRASRRSMHGLAAAPPAAALRPAPVCSAARSALPAQPWTSASSAPPGAPPPSATRAPLEATDKPPPMATPDGLPDRPGRRRRTLDASAVVATRDAVAHTVMPAVKGRGGGVCGVLSLLASGGNTQCKAATMCVAATYSI